MNEVFDILSGTNREWRKAGGATEKEIVFLRGALPFQPPGEYIEFLRYSNGGEGKLALEPLWFQLFEVDFAIQLWNDHRYRREYPNFFFFGSNGGLECIAFDMSHSPPWPIVAVDCVSGIQSAVRISEDILSFIRRLGISAE